MELLDDYLALFFYIIFAAVFCWEAFMMGILLLANDEIAIMTAERVSITTMFEKVSILAGLGRIHPVLTMSAYSAGIALNTKANMLILQVSNSYFLDAAVVFASLVINFATLAVAFATIGGVRIWARSKRLELRERELTISKREKELEDDRKQSIIEKPV